MSVPFLFSLSDSEKQDLFEAAATAKGWPAYVVEKDYHVTLVLSLLFEKLKPTCKSEVDTPFLFKGGTSLSKVYGCIDRMSEDIDLSLHMTYLGHPIPEPDEESNTARKKRMERLELAAKEKIKEVIVPFLVENLEELNDDYSVSIADNGLDVEINYPRYLDTENYVNNYVLPRVLLECGGRASFDPSESKSVSPIAMEATGQKGDECTIDVLGCDRTFFEKITLMHELNNRGAEHINERQSRHIYDIVRIYAINPEYVSNTELLAAVVDHKRKYFARGAAKWNEAIPGSLKLVPVDEVADLLKSDWEKMSDMFPSGLPYSFEELIEQLRDINAAINNS
ncbi:nucleotidyl transferase AbiEii/AbiGii toxin family protein [Alkalimarinus coralli]|uniref:nucleotidyl transferase AbiEii/AbiGii toxin family protein n=1 Tax=Alkalimarinus coralli TaxID=2935863 RepID=UPI00202ACD0D|nr:nucleotidyl transferase AbiEii/AbiGii toxin family protein [Alkalimarinus coralli]